MQYVQPYSRKRGRRGYLGPLLRLQLVVAIGLCACGVIFVTLHQRPRRVASNAPARALSTARARRSRPVYPYSLVPGGIANEREFALSRAGDPLLAIHYRDISPDVHAQTVTSDQMLYASYRIGGLIYWTKHTVLIHRGEMVLTDGSNSIRGRCGNRLSKTPQEPTRFVEPPSISGDAPVQPDLVGDAPDILADAAAAPDIPLDLRDGAPKPEDRADPPTKPGDNSGKIILSPTPTVFWPQPPDRQPLVVPEASTWMTMLGGLGLVAALARRKR